MARKSNRPKLSSWPGGPLPMPRKLTPEQAESVIAWFATLPEKELRYRQDLAITQMKIARDNPNQSIGIEAHENQFIVWKQLSAAIGRQQCQ